MKLINKKKRCKKSIIENHNIKDLHDSLRVEIVLG